ncbi:MAG: class B sortase [Clostridia bacterium]|nr:class B sortase [Clostridia bacterium]
MEEKKTRRRAWLIVLILCLLAFAAAAVLLVWHLWPTDTPEPPPAPTTTTTATTTKVALPDNPIDFPSLQKKNVDIIAWIEVPGTVINYPILQSGNDLPENYYLDHDENRKYKYAGSIYIQQMNRADFTHPNTVMYGHNMKNGSMFAALHKFRNKDFFDENQYMYVYTPGHILKYRIYSAYVYDNRHILNSFDFSDKEEYQTYLDQSLNPKSMTKQVREGVTVTTKDRIITLSTCTSNNRERYLVQGVLIHDQPTN